MFKRKNKTKGEYIFGIVNNVFMLLILVVMLYPVINQLAVSLSSNSAVMSGHVSIIPKDLNFNAYLEILSDKNFLTAIKNSALFTVMNTVIGMTLTAVFAYPLSKKHIKGRNTIMALLVFSMMFGTGGLIPNYLLMRSLKLVNTFWALTLPSAISIWNVIVLKNFYQQIPASLEESATVDGASPIIIFIKIILPLAVPSIAALTMFVAISSWNTFFNAIIYLTTPSKKMLQVYLRDIIQVNLTPTGDSGLMDAVGMEDKTINPDTIKAAALLCSTIPVMLVYPFVQKYFMAGLLVGSVKG